MNRLSVEVHPQSVSLYVNEAIRFYHGNRHNRQ